MTAEEIADADAANTLVVLAAGGFALGLGL